MTMTRETKTAHQDMLANVGRSGHVAAVFASPRLIAERRAACKPISMTPADYRVYRMGRGALAAEIARDGFALQSRYPRRVTRVA